MPKKNWFILSVFTCVAFGVQAQESGKDPSDQKTGIVRVIADTQLVHDMKAAVPGEDGPQMSGYRIQVYAGTERDEAQKIKTEIAINYGERTYMIYESPYFKVRVGDFRNRMEAQQLFHALKQKYTGILLVPGLINLPELKQ